MVKAQVKTGGRGKAGGVKFCATIDDVRAKAGDILGLDIKGHVVHRVLITPAADIGEEYYVSYLLDRANRTYLAMASRDGGMEIEQLAVERPEALAMIPVDALAGVDADKAAEIADAGRFPAEVRDQVIDVLQKLWVVFREEDAIARRGQPAGAHPRRPGGRPRRQGHPRRERRLPAARARGVRRSATRPTRWSSPPRRRASTT